MKHLLKQIINQLFAPYEVRVHWGELRAVHYAWSEDEAWAWVNCYPAGAVTIVGDLVMGNHIAQQNRQVF